MSADDTTSDPVGVDGKNVGRDDVLDPELSLHDPRAMEQVAAGVATILKYIARNDAVFKQPTARLALEVMVLLAVSSVEDLPGEAEFVRRIHGAVFEKRTLYRATLTWVTDALRGLETVENSDARRGLMEKLRQRLGLLDKAFAGLTVDRLEALLRSSSIGAKGAAKHGPAYTAADITLAVRAFGHREKSSETKGAAVERVAKLFRRSTDSPKARKAQL